MRGSRKTTPKVKDGRVQKKNNWTRSMPSDALSPAVIAFERGRPGKGYRHLLTKADLVRFISLLPDWSEIGHGLHTIVLDEGDDATEGWHSPGCIGICAWEHDLWVEYTPNHYTEHAALFEALRVSSESTSSGVTVQWTESAARAYQLLHVFLHELGHHHDRMTTDSAHAAARGERYAEDYASRYASSIWASYEHEFGL